LTASWAGHIVADSEKRRLIFLFSGEPGGGIRAQNLSELTGFSCIGSARAVILAASARRVRPRKVVEPEETLEQELAWQIRAAIAEAGSAPAPQTETDLLDPVRRAETYGTPRSPRARAWPR
jgi:hypothetical protein